MPKNQREITQRSIQQAMMAELESQKSRQNKAEIDPNMPRSGGQVIDLNSKYYRNVRLYFKQKSSRIIENLCARRRDW